MAEPLRVLLADFHRGWGGQAAYVLALARGLGQAGHRAWIACPPGSDLEERAREAGVAVLTDCDFRRGFRPLSFWRDVRVLGRFLRAERVQVVHTHGSQDCWRAALCSRPRRCRHVRTKHNSYPVRAHPANCWLYRRGVDRLVVVAAALKPLVSAILPPERIDVLHAPVADVFFDPPPGGGLRGELEVSPETPLVGVVARLVPDKGQDVVLAALREVRESLPGVRAVFAGDGSEFDRLVAASRSMGLGEVARFLGPRSDVPAITAALDVAVLASTGCDASSTVVKEALAAGRPVVATDVGGIREIVEDGVTGRIVPPGDPGALARAILATLADPEASRRAAERGRGQMRERFSTAAFVRGQLEIYASVLGGEAS
jgi:glycosyltransferase involved in cell wall biosynthesis